MKASPPPLYLVAQASRKARRAQQAPDTATPGGEFAGVFEHAAIGMALLGTDHRCLQVNRAFCAMLGYEREELLSCLLDELSPAQEGEQDLRLRHRMLAGELGSYQREQRYRHKSGRLLWGHFTCSLVRDTSGRPQYFIAQAQDITERKLAEQALRDSEERFRSLTMLSSDWYWEQDTEFRHTAFSSGDMLRPWRPVQHHAIGRRLWELDGVNPADPGWRQLQALLQSHQPFRDFEYLRLVDGQPHYFSASGEPVFDPQGVFAGYRGTAREVTRDRLAEQQLHEAQAMLHMAAQIGRLGGWACDPVARRLTWSQEVCAIHEVRQGLAPSLDEAVAFYAPRHREAMRATFEACLREGSPFDVEAQVVTAKGRQIWMRTIGEAEWDAQGRVRRLHGACQDISDSKQAAEEARQVAERLSTTLESLTDAFFIVDRDWHFTYANGEAERMLRKGRAQLLGRNLWNEFPELRSSPFGQQYQAAMATGSTAHFEAYYAPSGLWVQVKAYPSRQGLAIYVKDVSDRVRAQQEILQLNADLEQRVRQRTAQLEAANRELESFSYSIAHDLRAPLSSIDGFSQILERSAGALLDGRGQHYLSRIRRGVRQMGELTDGLLALANLSRASLRRDMVDLAVLARAAVAACSEGTPARAVEVEIAALLPAVGDPRLLAQVMSNLVGNAWKFTSRTQQPRIEIGARAGPGGCTVYFVRDNGAGFDAAHASKMFEAFQRMHSAAEFEGTGIGLAIVHKIITRHGGTIWAEGTPGQGACFYFALPQGADAQP